MLAEFMMYSLGQEHHLSTDIAQVARILRARGLHFKLGPLSTAVEGEWNHVFDAIRECHEKMLERHERVVTTVTIDDCRFGQHRLDEMVQRVEQELAAQSQGAEIEC